MKKYILAISFVVFVINITFSQAVEITPNSTDNLKIGDFPISIPAPQKGIIIQNKTDYLQSRITLIDDSDGGNVSSFLDSRASPSSFLSAMQLGTETNHPINFFLSSSVRARFNKNGNFGVGVPSAGYANKDYHKAKIEAYGVGDSSVVYGEYNPFKVSILGQAITEGSGTSNVGVMATTDGQAQSSNMNIGVMSIPNLAIGSSLPNAYYLGSINDVRVSNASNNLYGAYNLVSNSFATNTFPVYGTYNSTSNNGIGATYSNYSSATQYGTGIGIGNYSSVYTYGGDAYGTYNDVMANGAGKKSHGVYNRIDPAAAPGYGTYNYMSGTGGIRYGTYNDMTVKSDAYQEYGTYNDISGGGLGSKYGAYNNINRTNGFTYGLYNYLVSSGSTETNLRGIYTYLYSTNTNTSSSSYGEYISATASAGTIYGIYSSVSGTATSKYAGYFSGNVHVLGALSKSSGSFKIDHPLDPENKYLYHSFVESPDMMNVYNGNITTNAAGDATVSLPTYFEALNKDFRYQLTVIGQFAQAIVAEKIANNQFKIKTDKPNVEVSWQVTGIRQDAYANANRIQTEVDKPKSEVGTYLHPEAHGKPATKSIAYAIEEENRKANTTLATDGRSAPIKAEEKPKDILKQRATPWNVTNETILPKNTTTSTDIKE